MGNPLAVSTIDPQPPAKVTLADAVMRLDAATQVTPFIGYGRGGKPVNADLDSDSPHVLISAGSGGGKSVTLRTLACQILHHGGTVLVLDIKRISHMWA